MGKVDKLKTAKIVLAQIDMATDGYYSNKCVKKAKVKERQKGKQIIKFEVCEHKNIKAGMNVDRCRDCGEIV